MLKLKNINKSFGNNEIFKDFSYDFGQKGVVFVKGASGSGKTTLLRIIAGLEKIDSGEINKNGSLSYLFQEDRLLPWLSAVENIECVLKKGDERRNNAALLLKKVGLLDYKDADISILSGGMKRRIALCRALIVEPDILLLDEPMSALDSETKAVLLKEIEQFSREHLVIFVTHQDDDINAIEGKILKI